MDSTSNQHTSRRLRTRYLLFQLKRNWLSFHPLFVLTCQKRFNYDCRISAVNLISVNLAYESIFVYWTFNSVNLVPSYHSVIERAVFLRISNLVSYTLSEVHSSASFFLRQRDITFTASGAYLHVFKTKTIQFKRKILEIPLPVIPNSILCPVTTLTTYFSLVPASSDSLVFLAPYSSGFTPVLARHFNLFLKRCVSSIGEDPSHFSSPSFRKGGATFAFNCGVPTDFIKAQGDWKSYAYLVYLTLSSSKKTSPFERHCH